MLRISAYGQTGPKSGLPGFARIAQAYAGPLLRHRSARHAAAHRGGRRRSPTTSPVSTAPSE